MCENRKSGRWVVTTDENDSLHSVMGFSSRESAEGFMTEMERKGLVPILQPDSQLDLPKPRVKRPR